MGNTLIAVGGAFLAAGILARAGRRTGLPTIPFFMAAGVIFGLNTPGIALVEDAHDLELLAALGLVLLLFHLGLEFNLDDLVVGGRRLLGIGAVYLLLNVGGGFLFGLALGWGVNEALVVAGAVGISSSAIVTKLPVELRRLANPESRLILGIIVVEDIFLALYLALLQPVLGEADGAADAAGQFAVAFGFLLALGAVARRGARLVGRLVSTRRRAAHGHVRRGGRPHRRRRRGARRLRRHRWVHGRPRPGKSPVAPRIERLVLPLRDAFAALFFFAFGLTIDPGDVAGVVGPVAAAVALSIVLNVTAGVIAARLEGYGRNAAASIGLTILGRGEFSLILATLAVAAGLDERIGPFVALYVLVLAVLGPVLTARSTLLARLLPGRLFPPRPERAGSGRTLAGDRSTTVRAPFLRRDPAVSAVSCRKFVTVPTGMARRGRGRVAPGDSGRRRPGRPLPVPERRRRRGAGRRGWRGPAHQVAGAVARIEADPGYRARARELAAKLATEDGASALADATESVISSSPAPDRPQRRG